MRTPAQLESACTALEQHLQQLTAALIDHDPQALLSASAALQRRTIEFSQLLKQARADALGNPLLQSRIVALASGLSSRRELLIRQSMLVERALNAVVPATCKPTYATMAGPYGSARTSSGTIKALTG